MGKLFCRCEPEIGQDGFIFSSQGLSHFLPEIYRDSKICQDALYIFLNKVSAMPGLILKPH